MDVRLLAGTEEIMLYDTWVKVHPGGSLWQSIEWKAYQEALGRETTIYALMDGAQIAASALVVIDRTAFGFSTWDIPRGPIWDLGLGTQDLGKFLEDILEKATADRCLCLYISPTHPIILSPKSFVLSPSLRHEQPSATRVINLALSEEEILKQMKPKGRYNISVAEKNGVRVEESQDIDAFFALLKETGGRDQFGIKPLRHYRTFLKELQGSFLLLAFSPQNEPIAGLLGVIWHGKGIYYYGASKYDSRALMAPYALQWTAMLHCKTLGCASYDLLGIPPPDAASDHPWCGVGAFKEKFGGEIVIYPPEQQIVLRPLASWMLGMKRKLLG